MVAHRKPLWKPNIPNSSDVIVARHSTVGHPSRISKPSAGGWVKNCNCRPKQLWFIQTVYTPKVTQVNRVRAPSLNHSWKCIDPRSFSSHSINLSFYHPIVSYHNTHTNTHRLNISLTHFNTFDSVNDKVWFVYFIYFSLIFFLLSAHPLLTRLTTQNKAKSTKTRSNHTRNKMKAAGKKTEESSEVSTLCGARLWREELSPACTRLQIEFAWHQRRRCNCLRRQPSAWLRQVLPEDRTAAQQVLHPIPKTVAIRARWFHGARRSSNWLPEFFFFQ